jgi:hypothetical protein
MGGEERRQLSCLELYGDADMYARPSQSIEYTHGMFDPLLRDRKNSRETLAFLALAAEPKALAFVTPAWWEEHLPVLQHAARGLTSACACAE